MTTPSISGTAARSALLGRSCAVGSLCIAAVALWSWAAGVSDLVTIGSVATVSPTSSGALLLLSAAAFLQFRDPASRAVRWFASGTAALLFLVGAAALLFRVFQGSAMEQCLGSSWRQSDLLQPRFMCALSAGTLAAACAAMLLHLRGGKSRRFPGIARVLAGAVMAAAIWQIIDFALRPFERGNIFPGRMALTTAAEFALLGVSLLVWPRRPAGTNSSASGDAPWAARWGPLAFCWAFALFISGLTASYLRHSQAQDRHDARELLHAVGKLKESEIDSWRQERLNDARFFAQADFVAADIQLFLQNQDSPAARQRLLHWLRPLKAGNRYSVVALFDAAEVPRLMVAETNRSSLILPTELAAEARKTGGVAMSDLRATVDEDVAHIDVTFPVYGAEPGPALSATKKILGFVLLRIDPRQFLFPMVQTWPIPSRSAEIVVFRREGNDLIYLNELRFWTNRLVAPRFRLDPASEIPAIKALLYKLTDIDGHDYRGVPVLAHARSIPNTSWMLIAKIDREEIFASLRRDALLTLGLTILLVAAARSVSAYLAKRRQAQNTTRELEAERRHIQESAAAEAALRQSEERFRTVIEAAPEAIYIRTGSVFTYVNSAAVRLFGATKPEDLLGSIVCERFHPDRREKILGYMRLVDNQAKRITTVSEQFLRLDGSPVPVVISAVPFIYREERSSLVFARDMTEWQHTQEALRRSESALLEAQRLAEIGNWSWNPATGQQTWSPEVFRMFAREPALGPLSMEEVPRYFTPESWSRLKAALDRAHHEGVPYQCDLELVLPDGTHRWMTGRGEPEHDAAGRFLGLRGTIQEITARKQAEETLRKFSQVVEQSPISIMITDTAGSIEYVNPKFTRLTGYTLDEVRGKTPRILKSGTMPPAVFDELWTTIASGAVWNGEFHNRKKNGELFWELAAICPVVNESGRITHFLAMKEDITERKRLEAQLRQSQKLEAIGQLAGGVAHDFNNILTAIVMQLGLLQLRSDLDNELREAVADLLSHADRATSLTRQLLVFSRRSVVQMGPVNLNKTVEGLLKMLRRIIGEQVTLEWQPCPGLPSIKADPGMMDQIVMNLVVNARDAMPSGGCITIAAEVVTVSSTEPAGNPDRRDGPFLQLTVRDTGCGMDEAVLKRIFEPFFTTKEAGKGTGLGLATVYGIVRQHQGWITVDSAVGRGSTFSVFLPVAAGTLSADPVSAVDDSGPARQEVLLLVEDDPNVRGTTGAFLRRSGHTVLEAVDGLDAMRVFGENEAAVTLLISDMVMPNSLNGLQLTEQMRARRPDLKVIICSGYSAELVGQDDLAARNIVFLPKPCSAQTLAAAIRRNSSTPPTAS